MTEPLSLPEAPIDFKHDLEPFDDSLSEAEAEIMIRSAWAKAVLIAPCLRDSLDTLDPAQLETVKDALRDAILRWAERGAGAVVQRQAGEYSETLRAAGSTLFRPNEIRDLQNVCSEHKRRSRASTIPTGPWGPAGPHHAPWCSVNFSGGTLGADGATRWCDCGADLTGNGPLWGRP